MKFKDVCEIFQESSFVTYTDSPATHNVDGLTNAIHPIFARRRFRGEVRYDALIPSLRLASRLLTSDAATLFILACIDGKSIDNQGQETTIAEYARRYDSIMAQDNPKSKQDMLEKKHYFYAMPQTQKVTYYHRRRAAAILSHMAEFLTFVLYSKQDGTAAQAIIEEKSHTGHLATLYPEGSPSHIGLCKSSSYSDLVDTTYAATCSKDLFMTKNSRGDLITLRFNLASSIVHEIGHVLIGMKFGCRTLEVFCGGDGQSTCSEGGYALEAAIFGGLISGIGLGFTPECAYVCDDTIVPSFYLKPRPSPSEYLRYVCHGTPLGLAGRWPEFELMYRIPYSYIASLFEDQFWDTTLKQGRVDCVAPTLVGKWMFSLPLHISNRAISGSHPLKWHRVVRKHGHEVAFAAPGYVPADKCDLEPEDFLHTANLDWLS
jgi:hypothetical protein